MLPGVAENCIFHRVEWGRTKLCALSNVFRIKNALRKRGVGLLLHIYDHLRPGNASSGSSKDSRESDYINMAPLFEQSSGSSYSPAEEPGQNLNIQLTPVIQDHRDVEYYSLQNLIDESNIQDSSGRESVDWDQKLLGVPKTPRKVVRKGSLKKAVEVLITAITAVVLLKPPDASVGYDCGSDQLNVTTLSL